jgi:DMSO/TMAO reductase YedYZ molybdopterin-dependent catalytic subunit
MPEHIVISGAVTAPGAYTREDLTALDGQISDAGTVAAGRRGRAVRLAALLDAARPTSEARYLTLEAEAGYAASIPLEAVREQAIIIFATDGGPVPHAEGGPFRFLIPDVAACQTAEVDACANVKHLERLVLSAERGVDTRPRTNAQHLRIHRD